MEFYINKIKNFYSPKEELGSVYRNIALRNFALSMVAIFVPIYLIELGYTVSTVLALFLVIFLTSIVLAPFVTKIISHVGVKHTISISLPFLLLNLLGFYLLQFLEVPLFLIAILGGLSTTLYFVPFNIDFVRSSHKEKTGREVGYLFAVSKISLALGPLVGAFVISQFGFGTLFAVVISLIFLSMLTLIKGKDMKSDDEFQFKYMLKGSHVKYFFAFFVQGILGVAEVIIWPIFVFLFIAGTAEIGVIGALLTAGSIITSIIIGKITDKTSSSIIIKTGALLYAIVWLFRMNITSSFYAFVATFIAGLLLMTLDIPIFARAARFANKEGKVPEFITLREIGLHSGRFVLMILGITLVNMSDVFLASSISSLLLFFLI